jgi:hypothetical protein
MRAALACALSVALLAGCKPPIEQGARFKSIGFACTQHQNAVAADSAHASGNGLAVQALLRQGCVMVRLNTEITPVAKSGEYIQFTATPPRAGYAHGARYGKRGKNRPVDAPQKPQRDGKIPPTHAVRLAFTPR